MNRLMSQIIFYKITIYPNLNDLINTKLQNKNPILFKFQIAFFPKLKLKSHYCHNRSKQYKITKKRLILFTFET